MSDQIVAVAVVETDIEGPDQAAGTDFLNEEVSVDEHNSRAAQRVLDGKYRSIKYQAAVKIYRANSELPHELRPYVVTRKISDAHVDDLICCNEFRHFLVR